MLRICLISGSVSHLLATRTKMISMHNCSLLHIIENKIDRLSHQLLIVEDTRTRNNVLCWVKKNISTCHQNKIWKSLKLYRNYSWTKYTSSHVYCLLCNWKVASYDKVHLRIARKQLHARAQFWRVDLINEKKNINVEDTVMKYLKILF